MKISAEGRTALVVGGQGPVGQAIVAALSESGATVIAATGGTGLDFSSPDAAARSAAEFVAASGAPFLLVLVSAGVDADFEETGGGDDELDRFAVAARAFAPSVERIVTVISAAGVVPLRDAAAFSARQAALGALTRALAMELAPDVAVNALAVGAVGDSGQRLVSHSPLKRSATPAEVANAALFLADPANTYTTGHVMTVDGGWSIGYARDF